MSQFFASRGQSIGASASVSVLPMNIQDWFPLWLTGLISLQSKGLSRAFSSTTVQKHQFFGTQKLNISVSKYHTWYQSRTPSTVTEFVCGGLKQQGFIFSHRRQYSGAWLLALVQWFRGSRGRCCNCSGFFFIVVRFQGQRGKGWAGRTCTPSSNVFLGSP